MCRVDKIDKGVMKIRRKKMPKTVKRGKLVNKARDEESLTQFSSMDQTLVKL